MITEDAPGHLANRLWLMAFMGEAGSGKSTLSRAPFEGRLPGLEKKITKQTKNETGRTAMLKYLIVA